MAREVRMTLDQARARVSSVDWSKVHGTSDDDIRRQMIEDGEDPDNED